MVFSMTGYAALSRDVGKASLQIELRSVNSRYLDLAFRIVEDLRFAEPIVREQINASVSRGKIECRMSLQAVASGNSGLSINGDMLEQLRAAQNRVRESFPDASPLSTAEILRYPGVLAEEGLDHERLTAAVHEIARAALGELRASRAREGEKLVAMLRERVGLIRERVAVAAPIVPAAVSEYREKLTTRLREAVASLDEDRIRQEVTLFAQRADVAEEITRLNAHLDEVERVLGKGGAVGKRLDFLMQELNREANTLGSKAVSPQLTEIAVDLKVYIEQMREQVQNLE
ncbi:YicC/YloC family endoribonuclease [Uliginosibacterium aquaticum]|uniref:YicC family protein n=1 Tax=Uliginosibacterium aquaticum TaxID=2731212 RepID=A0ABX2INJ6_9RHOO|nr:YicC/YloC family endoribonuclease [Uliginosibacterium aquaticum]NSL55838.1 YicC family protein [Uliginosibacterium aquaticum]